MGEIEKKSHKEEKNIGIEDIVTGSENMFSVLEVAKTVAVSDINVLITGETGTGKELVARAIHNSSSRRDGPFVVVNCAGLPDTLIESELFGHEKGAFTDATSRKKGRFELANEGTIFLDEVGDLSIPAQPKTLRVIEEKIFERLGGEEQLKVNCRIISATNKDLKEEIDKGAFRKDLYYRLHEAHFELPALRERKDDIPLLVDYFIKEFNAKFNKSIEGASDVVQVYLKRYDWPGNVRELKSIIKIGMALIKGEQMWLEDLPFSVQIVSGENKENLDQKCYALDLIEQEHIEKILRMVKGNKVKAAKLLEISRPTLDRKINKYKIEM
jgi:transcriptional regulator with PAS, ATPase and Fis domain